MTSLDDWPAIRVVAFNNQECPTPQIGKTLFSWREHYALRNQLLVALGRYGTVGPMGHLPVLETWDLSKDAWQPTGSKHPDFFVIADMYNEWNRWHRVEGSASLVSEPLLRELVAMLMDWPDWCIYLALVVGGLTVFRDRVLYEGEIFSGSGSLADLAARCS
jgi:hypothetical protein